MNSPSATQTKGKPHDQCSNHQQRRAPRAGCAWQAGVIAFVAASYAVYNQLIPASEWLTSLFPVDRHSHTGEAIAFFYYDVPKVMMLLTLIVFAMGVVRSFFSPERTRALLAGKREGVGNVLSAGLGILAPFCSCSAVWPFINIVDAEARHFSALLALFSTYGITSPPNRWQGNAPHFASLHDACAAAVQAEIDNVAIYDRVLSSTTRTDILRVYSALREASLDRHLPAFRRCAERGDQ